MTLESAKQLRWGTYGPGALEAYNFFGVPLPEMRVKLLGECDTDHLHAIRAHVKPSTRGIGGDLLIHMAVTLILEDREEQCDEDE